MYESPRDAVIRILNELASAIENRVEEFDEDTVILAITLSRCGGMFSIEDLSTVAFYFERNGDDHVRSFGRSLVTLVTD